MGPIVVYAIPAAWARHTAPPLPGASYDERRMIMARFSGPPERRARRVDEAEDDTQDMVDRDDGPEGWARDVAACEDLGLD